MKKYLQLLWLGFAVLLVLAGIRLSARLPMDTRPYVEKKYAGWNGVLRAWICCGWEAGGSFTRWLNNCAADFEKSHDGVYIEFTPVDSAMLAQMYSGGLRPPELIFFSPGMIADGRGLVPVSAPDNLRAELRTPHALPVAMGGYIWVYNRSLCAEPSAEDAVLLPDADGRDFTSALAALQSGTPMPGTTPAPRNVDLDLGLPASAQALPRSDSALEDFIEGRLPCTIVTQAELARLERLRDAGRGPDWACAGSGAYAWTDQLLYAAATRQGGADGDAREALAEEFIRSLLEPDAQQGLCGIGAMSVTGIRIHGDLSPYGALDDALCRLPLRVPEPFSEH